MEESTKSLLELLFVGYVHSHKLARNVSAATEPDSLRSFRVSVIAGVKCNEPVLGNPTSYPRSKEESLLNNAATTTLGKNC